MKFYKITNESENHNGLQYKAGLNIDIKPFNPSGNCSPGGIYFAREDILAFLDYGCFIREVEIPSDAQVYENPGNPKKWKADKVILKRRRKITLNVIKQLVKQGADVHADDDYALQLAASNGQLEVVKYLVEQGADIHAWDDYALRWAAENGQLEVVKYLKSLD